MAVVGWPDAFLRTPGARGVPVDVWTERSERGRDRAGGRAEARWL